MTEAVELDFYTEASCGWAWRTAVWIRRVARERPIHVNWKLLALALINSPEDWTKDENPAHMQTVPLNRTMLLARRNHGNDAMGRLYVAYGNALFGSHELITWSAGGRPRPNTTMRAEVSDPEYQAVQRKCLELAELPADLFQQAMDDPTTLEEWFDESNEAVKRLNAFGTPTLALAGSDIGVFGPVIDPVPDEREGLALWDSVLQSLRAPYLFEMKRSRVRPRTHVQFAD